MKHLVRPETGLGKSAVMAATLCAILIFAMINPVGYVGGGQDDARYLTAARCWAEAGACLPANHWEGRWPIFAPISLLISLLGESRLSVQLWPMTCSLTAAWLLVEIALRLFGSRIAMLTGLIFVATPAFSLQLLTPSVEAIELAFVLAATLCLLKWQENQSAIWMLAGGIMFGLAFQVRETSIAAAGLVVVAMILRDVRPRPVEVIVGLAGFLMPLVVEFIVFQQATGDFLYRRHLSLAHTRIPSSELSSTVDTSRSPILNPEVIAGWRRQPGIHIHWLVDGPLNLLLNAKAGFSLALTPVLLIAGRRQLPQKCRRTIWALLGLATAYVVIINYFFAMDPKPRVMLVALAAGSVALAIVLDQLWAKGRRLLAAACFISASLAGAYVLAGYLRPVWAERQALEWVSKYPQSIEVDRLTRMMLTLRSELRSLPSFEAEKPLFLTVSTTNCRNWMARAGFDQDDMAAVGERRLSLFPMSGTSGAWICLLRYRRAVSADEMDKAVRIAWTDRSEAGPATP